MSENNCFCHNRSCLINNDKCCWCLDKNTNKQIYIDGCGLVKPSDFNVVMPRDLYYCAKCKITNKTQFDIIQELTTRIPSVYEELIKIKKEENEKKREESTKKNSLQTCEKQIANIKKKLSDLSNPKSVLFHNTVNPASEIKILKAELKEVILNYDVLRKYYANN